MFRPLTILSRSFLVFTFVTSLVLCIAADLLAVIPPPSFEYPYWVKHGTQRVDSLMLENTTPVTITVLQVGKVIEGGPGDWLAISPTGPFDIPVAGVARVDLIFNPGGAINAPGTVVNLRGYLFVRSSQAPPNDSITLPIDFNVADTVVATNYDTIYTSCAGLVVRNDGNMGNEGVGKVNLDYWYSGDCDTLLTIPGETQVYLRNASPVIVSSNGSMITSASWGGFGADHTTAHGFKPVIDNAAPLFKFESFSGPGYTGQRLGQSVTSDSSLAVERTVYAPTHPDSCNFMIVATRIFPNPDKPGTKSGLAIMELTDWDVPADTAALNTYGFNVERLTVYQQGVEKDNDGDVECQENNARYAGTRLLSTCWRKTTSPPQPVSYVRALAPYLTPAGIFNLDSLWNLAQIQGYDFPAAPSEADWFTATNLGGNLTIPANDTLSYTLALATMRNGTRAQFMAIMEKAKAWYESHQDVGLGCSTCECCIGVVGNLDGDPGEQVDIGDLQRIIDGLFSFPGPGIVCMEEADMNGDGAFDISDLQALVDYLFFGGVLQPCAC